MKAPVRNRPARIRTTDAQIDAAVNTARARKSTAVRIVAAVFDRKRDAITIALSNGAEMSVPRSAIDGLNKRKPMEIADLAVQPSGFSVWSQKADAGVRLETLLEAVAGTSLTSLAARIIASRTSPAKAAAARRNGRKGGRPKAPRAKQTATKRKAHAAA